MRRHSFLSWTLVIMQVACMFFLLLSGPILADSTGLLVLQAAALAVGLWAVLVMGVGRFGIHPEPVGRSRLTTSGPYQWIRHPMYASVLLFFGGLTGGHFSGRRLAVFLVLGLTLLIKMHYEEGLLINHFQGYADYRKKTKRIIPFLY